MSREDLAVLLRRGAAVSGWPDRAAVELIATTGMWLDRAEFVQAIEVEHFGDGTESAAFVAWEKVDVDAAASNGELRLLHLACSIAGVASERPLADLVSLDRWNTARLFRALLILAEGSDDWGRLPPEELGGW